MRKRNEALLLNITTSSFFLIRVLFCQICSSDTISFWSRIISTTYVRAREWFNGHTSNKRIINNWLQSFQHKLVFAAFSYFSQCIENAPQWLYGTNCLSIITRLLCEDHLRRNFVSIWDNTGLDSVFTPLSLVHLLSFIYTCCGSNLKN